MADFEIQENPEYTEAIRKFEVTDPAHAELLNPIVQTLINNETFLKKLAENHLYNEENPHNVTKNHIGLGNVNNTADANKHVNSAGHLRVLNDNYRQGTDLPSTYPQGEVIFFSNNPPTARFNEIPYCTIHTIKGYSNMACIQFLYPYNTNHDRFYFRQSLYDTDAWRSWYEVITSKNIGSQSVNYAASAGSATSATSATKATQDGDGKVIKNTYVRKEISPVAIGQGASSQKYGVSLGLEAKGIGDSPIAIGFYSMANGYSVAIGNAAKAMNNSIAIGDNANGGGSSSIALGDSAKASNELSTALGYGAKASGNYSVTLGCFTNASGNYSSALGHWAVTSNDSSIQLGNASTLSSITARVAITVTSDERDKADITEMDSKALDFLKKVKAIRYVFNSRELYINEENLSDEERKNKEKYGLCAYDREEHAKGTKKGNRIRTGVSAQNVLQALKEVYGDSSYANLVNDNFFDLNKDEIPEGVENQLAVNYEGFIPFLIKAVQELSARLEALESKNGEGTA